MKPQSSDTPPEIEEIILEKLEAAEDDVREGQILSHEDVLAETARWFSE